MSKGRFDEAEKILRHIAVVNKRNFDSDAFEQVKETQTKVSMNLLFSMIYIFMLFI